MVKVTADPENLADKPDSFFENFDVICATECTEEQLVHINQVCRQKGIKFFCGDVFGMFGYTFADLQIHEFAEYVYYVWHNHILHEKKNMPVFVLMYSSENWSLNRSGKRKIEAAKMRFLRPMAGYTLLDKKEVVT